MAEIVWAAPALADLEAIAEYIAVENPTAAAALEGRVYEHVGQLENHPESGPRPAELRRSRRRQIVEPPCRVLCRHDGSKVFDQEMGIW